MGDKILQHRRVHNLLLIQKLFSLRQESSPFTLILDSIEQSAKPLIERYIHNAKTAKTNIIYVSFEGTGPPPGITMYISARRKTPTALHQEIASASSKSNRTLLVLSTLHPLLSSPHPIDLPTYLSTLMTPTTSLLAIYHTDIPLPPPPPPSSYSPPPLTLLRFLATTILTPHSFPQTLARKRAAEKSAPEPVFGLAEEKEGVVVGLGGNDTRGLVLEMEYRRKSGRGVEEVFFIPPPPSSSSSSSSSQGEAEKIMLLDDHPLYNPPPLARGDDVDAGGKGGQDGAGVTFELGLTEKQRREREGVVLPYFDAQGDGGVGAGGRILYEMGVEDDFDEEEDEV